MNVQSINITNKNQNPNFKGIRLPAGEVYKTIYPHPGIRNDIELLASQGRLTKEQVSSLNQILGNDDVHLEKSDGNYLVTARKFSMINKSENFKALEQIIKNALKISSEGVDSLCHGLSKMRQNIAKLGGNTSFIERCREAFVDDAISQVRRVQK